MNSKFFELGSLAEFINGVAFKPDDWGNNGYKIIRIQNLTDPTKPYNKTTRKVDSKYLVHKGDLLVSWSASLGVFEWDDSESALVNQHIFRVQPDYSLVDKRYLRHGLELALLDMQQHLHGATMQHVNRGEFLATRIFLPPLPEQRRIAAILDQAEALRAKRRQALAQLDELTQSIFLEMFGDPIDNPKKWLKEKMGNLMHIRRGGSPRPIEQFLGGTINWIKIGDATKGDDIYITHCADKIIETGLKKTVYLKAGSLIFANCGVSLGFCRILKIDGCIHDGWLSFENIIDNKLNKMFLLKALNGVTARFRKMAPDGTQPNLNTDIMKNFEIILPPILLQNKFADQLNIINRLKSTQRESLAQLDSLFASLQHRAFQGEL